MFGTVFYFGDVFESVFATGDVLGNSIFTRDVFESQLQSYVNKQLVCNLVILINCKYFKCDVFGSLFYCGDLFGSVLNTGDVLGSAFVIGEDVHGLHKNRLLSLKH
jgi:hypothetical protein